MLRSCSIHLIRQIQASRIFVTRRQHLQNPNSVRKHRHFSILSICNQLNSETTTASSNSNAELDEFMSAFPDVLQDLTNIVKVYDRTPSADASNWFRNVILYNVPKGKRNKGLLTVRSCKLLQPQNTASDEQRLALYLGWCVEMVHSYFLIADDIIDHSSIRYNVPCWYKLPTVGMKAVNDFLMIEYSLFTMLAKHFGDRPNYIKLVELFREAMLSTTIGQSLDMLSTEKDVNEFTIELYKATTFAKTPAYCFNLPVAAAMYFAGFSDPNLFASAKKVLYEIGYFYNVQDDYLDCFVDPAITGKTSSDIPDKKCTWFAVQFMARANEEQKALYRQHYGKADEADIAMVMSLYEQTRLREIYAEYEEKSYKEIELLINQLPDEIPKSIFQSIIFKLYRRNF